MTKRNKGERKMQGTWDKKHGSEATIPPVIANAVKQFRRKTPTNSPVLDCFVPRNDEKGQGRKENAGNKGQGTRYKEQAGKPRGEIV
jgi:hypothetical protein